MRAAVGENHRWSTLGRALWAGKELELDVFKILLELNAGYLLVTAAAALSSMKAWADEDEASGRCALLLEAAADTWSRGYFMGISAEATEAPASPSLSCP